MRIDPAGWPFVSVGLILALAATLFVGKTLALVLFVLTGFFLFFFRDPDRVSTAPPKAVLAPADGRVMVSGPATAKGFSPAEWQQISIFLSPMDVHVNRTPVGGRVIRVKYHPGRFLPAYRDEAADLNEHTEIALEHDGQQVIARQIVGVLARRIVCRVREGDVLRAGDRIGVMKFGSRMDVFVPHDATVQSKVGDSVVGGVTVMACLAPRTQTVPAAPETVSSRA